MKQSMDILVLLLLILLSGKAYSQGDGYMSEISSEDMDGLRALADALNFPSYILGGNPCFHSGYVQCSTSNPQRVTEIALPSLQLHGSLPNFEQMQALKSIDLSYNKIYGHIPEFLGSLPNLTYLDLQQNQLSGDIPKSITHNKQLTYNLQDNPKLHHPKEKNLGLIIGLPVGLFLGITLPGLLVCIILKTSKKKPQPIQGQVTTINAPSNLENGTTSSSQVQILQGRIDHQNNPPSAPGFDQNELNELLRLHNNKGS